MSILNNIAHAEVLTLKDQVAYADGQVVSKTLVQNKGLGISTHESKGDAFVTALDGAGIITIDGEKYELHAGESIVMPANHPHSVYATKDVPFKMLLVVAFPE